jgi:steroid delta-isomerase-like uncharacterized protein
MSQNGMRTLLQWAELWSSHDIDALLSLFTDDCVYEDVTLALVHHGKSELRAFADGFIAACPDLRMELMSQFVSAQWAAMEWVMSGTHDGDLPGLPASHKKFSIRGASVAELDGTRIRRISDYWDLTAFLKQLGFMPTA